MVFESVEGDQVWLHICEGIRKQRQDFLQRVSLRINTPCHQIFWINVDYKSLSGEGAIC